MMVDRTIAVPMFQAAIILYSIILTASVRPRLNPLQASEVLPWLQCRQFRRSLRILDSTEQIRPCRVAVDACGFHSYDTDVPIVMRVLGLILVTDSAASSTSSASPVPKKGRGAAVEPPNRFGVPYHEADYAHFDGDEEFLAELGRSSTQFLSDSSRSVVSENDSPDIPFRYSVNPYRGCEHGCSYCYARPYHEYLGLNAGLDFETKIFVKQDAPALFRDFLARDAWRPEPIMFSGVTDCYQPAERRFGLTRGCLEVALECRQPVMIITKNALVLRDLDLLRELAALRLVSVAMSVTTLDAELARTMEPRTSPPASRFRAVRELTAAGVPARVMTAPILPGLNDSEIPALLKAAKKHGALSASYTLLRLPYAVKDVFLEWLRRTQPTKAAKVEGLIRTTRDGELSDPKFGSRMRGTGEIADQIRNTFKLFQKRYGLDAPHPELDTSQFRPPKPASGQLRLF